MPSEQSSSELLTDAIERGEAKLADALWRERVAEVAIVELRRTGEDVFRRHFAHEPHKHVLDLYDGERYITAADVLYVLDNVGRRS